MIDLCILLCLQITADSLQSYSLHPVVHVITMEMCRVDHNNFTKKKNLRGL